MKGRLYQKLLSAEAKVEKLEKQNTKLKAELDGYKEKAKKHDEFIQQEFEDKQNGIIRS